MTQHLFDEWWRVGETIAQAPHRLLCLDFDGTLTPFDEDPGRVRLSREMQELVRSLAGRKETTVAIISGREKSDLQKRVGIEGIIYAGNHGLEVSGPGLLFVEPTALAFRDSLQELMTTLEPLVKRAAGAVLEDKGVTIAVHYRKVAEDRREEVGRFLEDALSKTSHPFVLTPGELAYEIRPPVAWNRGVAMRWLKEKLGHADILPIYVGADSTDEEAFLALPDGITIKVGPAPATAARYMLESQEEVAQLLGRLDELLQRGAPAAAAAEGGR